MTAGFPIVWPVDNDYPFHHLLDEHVAWFDGHFRPPHFGDSFIQRAAAGKLPSVSWIDPSFADLRTGLMRLISPPSNDDHPPSDVAAGQALVLKVYDALASSKRWPKTLLVITYDEHGGFFDHVPPPLRPADDNPTVFKRYGVRDKVAAVQKDSIHEQLTLGATPRAAAKTQLTDLQHDYLQVRTHFMEQLIEELPARLSKSF